MKKDHQSLHLVKQYKGTEDKVHFFVFVETKVEKDVNIWSRMMNFLNKFKV